MAELATSLLSRQPSRVPWCGGQCGIRPARASGVLLAGVAALHVVHSGCAASSVTPDILYVYLYKYVYMQRPPFNVARIHATAAVA